MNSLKDLPDYLPVRQRPRCQHCRKTLAIVTMIYATETRRAYQSLFREKAEYIGYGCQGKGFFCSLKCGHAWALRKLESVRIDD